LRSGSPRRRTRCRARSTPVTVARCCLVGRQLDRRRRERFFGTDKNLAWVELKTEDHPVFLDLDRLQRRAEAIGQVGVVKPVLQRVEQACFPLA
jgi:hypothetical protein